MAAFQKGQEVLAYHGPLLYLAKVGDMMNLLSDLSRLDCSPPSGQCVLHSSGY